MGIYGIPKPIFYWFYFVLFIACSTDSISQVQSFQFKNLSVVDGLPENSGTAILQTHDGYMWIGTQGGLVRSNGYQIRSFIHDREIPGSISANSVFTLFEDRLKNLWIGTGNGINLYNPYSQTFKGFLVDSTQSDYAFFGAIDDDSNGNIWTVRAMPDNSLELWRFNPTTTDTERFIHDPDDSTTISSPAILLSRDFKSPMIVDRNNTVWLGTAGGGLNYYEPETNSFRHYRNNPDDPESIAADIIYAIYEPKHEDGILWVTTFDGQLGTGVLQRLNTETGKFTRITASIPSIHLNIGFMEDDDGTLWMGDNWAIHKYTPSNQSFETYPVPETLQDGATTIIWNLARDYSGRIWLRTESTNKTLIFEPETAQYAIVNVNKERPEGSITFTMTSDHAGLIWFGTWSYGLLVLDPVQSIFQHIRLKDVVSDRMNRVTTMYQAADGFVWMGTDLLGLTTYNPQTGVWNDVQIPGFNPAIVTTIRSGGSGKAWIAYREATGATRVVLLDLQSRSIQPVSSSLTEMFESTTGIVREVFTDSKGFTWFAFDGGGIVRLGPDGSVNRFAHDPENPSLYPDTENRPFSFFEDDNGLIWIGTNLQLLQFNPENEQFSVVNFNWSPVLKIVKRDDGRYLIGTYLKGLISYDPTTGSQIQYDESSGLSHSIIFDIAKDTQGSYWFSTGRGISTFRDGSDIFTNFGSSSGIMPTTRSALIALQDGTMLLIGQDGFYKFNPNELQPNPNPPKLVLSGIRVFNKELWPLSEDESFPTYNGNSIVLAHDQNMVSLDFTGLYFSNSEEIKYSHKLEGFDEDWNSPTTYRTITYTNLAPGTYHLWVRASNPDLTWSDDVSLLTFEILPPWWRTWWAYGFYLIVIVATIITIDRAQRRRIIKKEEERTRERELEHAREIEKAYNNLEVAHENLKSAQDQLIQQEKLASLGQLTAGIAHEIKNPLNFVTNFSAVSIEMVDETVVEIEKVMEDNNDRSFILDTLSFIKANLGKINEHGTRADGIVKSMLMHSRSGSGKLEPTDFNSIINEYANLAFHGMRAGKNAITADVTMDLDQNIGEVPLLAEDFSRVILNLCNNAFDAMRDKVAKAGSDYRPHLTIRTKQTAKGVDFEVIDNGPGIPDAIRDKILQPFFTTKKGTEGTGLGLSITNDIIAAHRGTLSIDSSPDGTTFRVSLPIS